MSHESCNNSPIDKRVIAAIGAELGRQNMSKAALARRIDVSEMCIHRRLKGEVEFTLSEVEAIAEVLNVPLEKLIGGDR